MKVRMSGKHLYALRRKGNKHPSSGISSDGPYEAFWFLDGFGVKVRQIVRDDGRVSATCFEILVDGKYIGKCSCPSKDKGKIRRAAESVAWQRIRLMPRKVSDTTPDID